MIKIKYAFYKSVMKYPRTYGGSCAKYRYLYHALMCTGSGFEWINGELIDVTEREKFGLDDAINKVMDDLEDKKSRKCNLGLSKELSEKIEKASRIRVKDEALMDLKTIRDRKLIWRKPLTVPSSTLISWSAYCNIFNIPKDITNSWRRIIKEFIESTLKADNVKFAKDTYNIFKNIKEEL